MPAPSLAVLFNHQEQIEAAIKAGLLSDADLAGSGKLSPRIITSRDTFDLDTHGAIALVVTPGPATGNMEAGTRTTTGFREYNEFSASLDLTVLTQRRRRTSSTVAGIDQRHSEMIARIRARLLLGTVTDSTSDFAMDYLAMLDIQFQGQTQTVEDEANDQTSLSYGLRFIIKPEAWPAS